MDIYTYKDLHKYLNVLPQRSIKLTIVRSSGGLGKTYQVEQILKQHKSNYIVVAGKCTPLELYTIMFDNPSSIIVLDDVDTMLRNKDIVAILKVACNLKENINVQYNTSRTIKSNNKTYEKSFISNNTFIFLLNDVNMLINSDLHALYTRSLYINFNPSYTEVFNTMKSYATNKDILKYLYTHIESIEDFNLRLYEKCLMLHNAGLCYKDYIQREYIKDYTLLLMHKILSTCKSKKEFTHAYHNEIGKSTKSMYNDLKKYSLTSKYNKLKNS